MAYHELIKNFEKIRDYMRDFYVYGFRCRGEYTTQSARTYDNERRRIESYLGSYLSFRQDESGKNTFLSFDSAMIAHNPFFRALQAKSFTQGDILLHFFLLDILEEGGALPLQEILTRLDRDYLSALPQTRFFDASTVRKKLTEYVNLGLLSAAKNGKSVIYRRTPPISFSGNLPAALAFFSEVAPLGFTGTTMPMEEGCFLFKHHYIAGALDSEILLVIFSCMEEERALSLKRKRKDGRIQTVEVLPLRLLVSVQTGRQHLLCFQNTTQTFLSLPLSHLLAAAPGDVSASYANRLREFERLSPYMWGVICRRGTLRHVEMRIAVSRGENYIIRRLQREKRNGAITKECDSVWLFAADVIDPDELLQWARTFFGRILSFTCSDPAVQTRFWADFEEMKKLYGLYAGGERL